MPGQPHSEILKEISETSSSQLSIAIKIRLIKLNLTLSLAISYIISYDTAFTFCLAADWLTEHTAALPQALNTVSLDSNSHMI